MLFDWTTKVHGPCLVHATPGEGNVSVIIAWGPHSDGASVEYRIAHLDTDDRRQRLDRAVRLAMGHFDSGDATRTGLINLAVDAASVAFEGKIPPPHH